MTPAVHGATVGALIASGAQQLARAGVAFGHGTANAQDETAWLVLWRLGLPLDLTVPYCIEHDVDAPAVKWLMQGDLVAIAFASVKHHRTKHWALAVGVEGLVVGQSHFPQRILLLDSGGGEPCFHAHNARLRLPDAGPGSRRAKPGWHKAPKQKMIIWMHESESWQPEAVRLLAAIRVRRTS